MDEKELSIDEFRTMSDQYKEINIDLDEFGNYFIERETEQLYEDEISSGAMKGITEEKR